MRLNIKKKIAEENKLIETILSDEFIIKLLESEKYYLIKKKKQQYEIIHQQIIINLNDPLISIDKQSDIYSKLKIKE